MWNYRVVRIKTPETEQFAERNPYSFEIQECYYNEDEDGRLRDENIWAMSSESKDLLKSWTEVYKNDDGTPDDVYDGYKDLLNTHLLMGLAFTKPVIDMETFKFAKPDFEKEPYEPIEQSLVDEVRKLTERLDNEDS